jgi:hypothetical protein
MFASTQNRVMQNTSAGVNQAIEQRMEECVARCAAEGPHAIEQRLAELDREWDIERMLETNFATLVLAGSALGLGVNRRFMLLPAIAAGFMVQHVLQGWCPPIPVLRRMGFRTTSEIDREKYALKALRGDFDVLHKRASTIEKRASRALKAANE